MVTSATIKDVARRAGVAPSTVSRVLNGTGYVSEDVARRVRQAVEELDYQPNAVARTLRQHRSRTIGVIFPDISNAFFMTVARGLEDQFQPLGYQLLFASTREDTSIEDRYVRAMLSRKVDGIVLSSSHGFEEIIDSRLFSNVPVVLVDRRIQLERADAVLEDNFLGMRLGVTYLLDRGHTRIGLIAGPKRVSTSQERVQGFLMVMAEHRISVPPEWIVWGDYQVEGGYRGAEQLLSLEDPPSALFAANNLMAVGALRYCRDHGIQIPEDLSLVSFGQVEFSDLMNPPLTVVRQSAYEVGVHAAEMLLSRLERSGRKIPARQVILAPQLEEGGSVRMLREGSKTVSRR